MELTRKKKLVIGVIAGILVSCIAMGVLLWYMSRETAPEELDANGNPVPAKVEKKEKVKLVYKTIPDMVVNIKAENEKMLSDTFELGVVEEKSVKIIEGYMPKLQSDLIIMLKKLSFDYLKNPENQKEMLEKFREQLNDELPEPVIEEILVTRYIMN